jgi:hypothetical protein
MQKAGLRPSCIGGSDLFKPRCWLDLDGLKAMFDQAKAAHGDTSEDLENLIDHLDPTSSFEIDIGGQG